MRSILVSLAFVLFVLAPVQAFGVTRSEAVERGRAWIDAGVMYSQSRYHDGYRQDCSGFVSMAWNLGDSLTTSSLDEVSHRIDKSDLQPGDAMLRPGRHVVLFVEWVDKDSGEFLAYEESTWGKPARQKVKNVAKEGRAIRFDGIEEDPVPLTEEQRLVLKLERERAEAKAHYERMQQQRQREEEMMDQMVESVVGMPPILSK